MTCTQKRGRTAEYILAPQQQADFIPCRGPGTCGQIFRKDQYRAMENGRCRAEQRGPSGHGSTTTVTLWGQASVAENDAARNKRGAG